MAKKGGIQQLQADISTNEEFEKFLERPGLLVMDVYTEWCGPCVGMIGSLKKIKLEIGGDNLQLAICKSDTITALERFRNKSEPTWLFASHGKAVNLMFGTNVPQLIKLITKELQLELEYFEGRIQRTFYVITELQPIELERIGTKRAKEEEARRIEIEAARQKRHDYLLYVTNEIMKNMAEYGITIFGPHINRDVFKKILDVADLQMLQCKDRKVATIIPDNLEILQFNCPNPLSDDVWEYLFNKELLVCLWKKDDNDSRDIHIILDAFVKNLITSQPVNNDNEFNTTDITQLPPLIPSIQVSLSKIIKENNKDADKISLQDSNKSMLNINNNNIIESTMQIDDNYSFLQELEGKTDDKIDINNKENSIITESETETKSDSIQITIPGVWAPGNRTGHAAGIYVFFRSHTTQFLPPDPEPQPPHLIVAFEAYKRKNIEEVCERFKEAILSYGYFTSHDPETAKLITNSTKKYDMQTPNVSDKLVLKVAKVTSHALLTLAAHGPAYISPNTVTGEKECKIFFPENYKTGEMEEEELKLAKIKNAEKKKKKKKKKSEITNEEQVGTAVAQDVSTEEQQENEESVIDEEHGDDFEGDGGEDENDPGEEDEDGEKEDSNQSELPEKE